MDFLSAERAGWSVGNGVLNTKPPIVGRLAPTPSGHLHLGNCIAFAAAWLSVRSQEGTLLLRLGDIDTTRSRPEIADAQRQELEWLGLTWDVETPQQSSRTYDEVLRSLAPHTYQCICTRAMIQATGGRYQGTCREAKHHTGSTRFRLPPGDIQFIDRQCGPVHVSPDQFGDPNLVRRDGIVSYNLAVVADDIRDGVTEVVRGADLLEYTAVQLLLYRHLKRPSPTWLHSPLILGQDEKKLSKSHGAMHVAQLRSCGWTPERIWECILPWLGLPPLSSLSEAIPYFTEGAALPSPLILHTDSATVPSPEEGLLWTTKRENS